jgi:protein-tyrosine phosphatase
MARPRAGDWLDDEISGWRSEGIDIVVSLLTPEEVSELGLRGEADLCRAQGMEFIPFPIPDRGVPEGLHEAMALSKVVATRICEGKAVAVHCRAGIGRSSLVAACALVCAGFDPEAAFDIIRKARGVTVPDTAEQRDWVIAFRDAVAAAAVNVGAT